jgi:sulfur carrier protein ThiS
VRLLHAPVLSTRAAEKYGCSTRKIMADLGYSNPEIVAMLETHAIGEQWSEHYLPD